MDSFEVNKILGAVLGTMTFTLGLMIVAEMVFEPRAPEKPGYEIAVAEQPGAAAPAAAVVEPIAVRLASADPTKGEAVSKQCASCHSFGKGDPKKTGPNLFGVVGGPKAHEGDFGYSAAMKGAGGTWTFEDLDEFLTNPKGKVPGTAMTFTGIRRPDQRADLIAFLNKNSDKPLPLPEAPAAAPAPAPGDNAAGETAPPAAPAP